MVRWGVMSVWELEVGDDDGPVCALWPAFLAESTDHDLDDGAK